MAGGDAAPCKRPAHATAYQLACARISGPASCTCACPACTAAGVKLKPTNGYRSIARQQELWDARVKTLMEGGLSQADAETKAIDYTSAPGTSDHNTGLGLDIVSEDHPAKDAGFAETAAAQWLAEHAADYGFILRYPSDKTEATGMDYEPWHYRYVGSEQAHKIKESGLCLEEYLAQ